MEQPAITSPQNEGKPSAKKAKNLKRKQQLQHSADIVFTKGSTIQTMPSLSKQLKTVGDCVIGLQFIWEYRSPSKSVPPHYQCKLCAVTRLQHDMLAHVKGWKHSFRYLKRAHPDKVTCEEEEAIRDPAVRKKIKEAAAEVEKTEGRGQLKVILKEPCDVHAFKGLRTAVPKVIPPPGLGMGPQGPPFGPRFAEMFPREYPRGGGPFPDYPMDEFRESGFGGYSGRPGLHGPDVECRPFPDVMGHRPDGSGGGFGPGDGRNGYGRSGPMEENPGRRFPDEYQSSQMRSGSMNRPLDKPVERPGLMGAAPEANNLPNTLLSYLDTFRIENEGDAQLVLKVTQKLTDVLMEYRLRSVSSGPNLSSSLNSSSMGSMGFTSSSRLPSSGDRLSGSLTGSSRYSDGPPRFYK